MFKRGNVPNSTFSPDITEYERVEEKLRAAERNFRHSLDNSPLGIRIINIKAEGETIYANRAILDIYGYSSIEELKSIPAVERHTPKSYAERQERVSKREAGKPVPDQFEQSIIRKDGEVRHLEVFHRGILWDGKTQFQLIYHDITERKRAEEALKSLLEKETKSAREWQETFDAVSDIVALISPDFEILKVNRAGYEVVDEKREELIGKKCYEVVHGLEAPIEGCPCVEMMKTKKACSGEITQDGRHYIATASPILDKNDELVAFAHTIKDITERDYEIN